MSSRKKSSPEHPFAAAPRTGIPDHAFAGAHQEQLEAVVLKVDGIWNQVAALTEGRDHARVLFTSPENGTGTTLMTAATAVALARNTRSSVLLVEAHMRKPAAATYLGTEGTPGLSDLLLGHADVESAVHGVPGVPDLHLLPGGTPRPAITGEFATPAARDLVGELSRRTRFTLFDVPPLLEYREARGLLHMVDAAVVVIRSRVSLKSQTARLADVIEGARVPILGAVLNRHESEFSFLPGQRS